MFFNFAAKLLFLQYSNEDFTFYNFQTRLRFSAFFLGGFWEIIDTHIIAHGDDDSEARDDSHDQIWVDGGPHAPHERDKHRVEVISQIEKYQHGERDSSHVEEEKRGRVIWKYTMGLTF